MRIIDVKKKKSSDWTKDIVKASIKKEASLQVDSGEVTCPMTGGLRSTINCELCQHCSGINLKIASASEVVKCTYTYDIDTKDESDLTEKFAISSTPKGTDLSSVDLKSIFAKSELEDNFDPEESMSNNKIVSAKNISEDEFEGSSNFVSEYSNSVFNPNTLAELESVTEQIKADKKADVEKAKITASERRSEWLTDREKELEGINYTPSGSLTKSISHESLASNPDVGEYKFSMFSDIKDKLESIPDRTQGEFLKEQHADRKKSISRTASNDDWENEDKSPTTSSKIVEDFFGSLF